MVKETKEEVIKHMDIEGKYPCEKCWKKARDHGIYAWPLRDEILAQQKRCKHCGRII